MHKLLVTGLALASLAVGVPPAAADDTTPHRYVGGCWLSSVDDPTPNALGGARSWHGTAVVLVRTGGATAGPTVQPVAAACELFVDGVAQGVVVSGSGHGVAAGVASVAYQADPGDTVRLCAHVTVGTPHTHCDDVAAVPVIPEPVVVLIEYLVRFLNEHVDWLPGNDVCYLTGPFAGYYGPVLVDHDGDVYLFGTDEEHLWWDCPPYYVPPGG